MDKKLPYIFNIQKFSLHDGPGIRTTVFFKGCPLRCAWCHNPESQRFEPERMKSREEHFDPEMMESGEEHAEPVGKTYELRELMKILKKDQIFYDQSGGGVTLSGGEVMAQPVDYVEELAKMLQREGISLCIDTSGFAPREKFERLLPFTDLFLYDLKCLDETLHQSYTGVCPGLILENLKYLSQQGANIELRMIMLKGINMAEEMIRKTACWLKEEKISLKGITLLPYHDLGRDKYRKLNRECTMQFQKPDREELERVKAILEEYGFSVKIQS